MSRMSDDYRPIVDPSRLAGSRLRQLWQLDAAELRGVLRRIGRDLSRGRGFRLATNRCAVEDREHTVRMLMADPPSQRQVLEFRARPGGIRRAAAARSAASK